MSVGGARRFARLRQSLLGRRYWQRYRFTSGNEVKLLRSGDEFFTALIERIDAAQRDVVLETYIFCDDSAGEAVSAALLRAASRGVKVIQFRLDRSQGNRAAFVLNDRILNLKPVEAVICEGSGIQQNLAQKLRQAGVPLHIVRLAHQRTAQRA